MSHRGRQEKQPLALAGVAVSAGRTKVGGLTRRRAERPYSEQVLPFLWYPKGRFPGSTALPAQ